MTAFEELKAWCEKWDIPFITEANYRQGVKYITFKEGVVILTNGESSFAFDTNDEKPL